MAPTNAPPLPGYHAMIDGVGKDPGSWTPDTATRVLKLTVEHARMTLIAGPSVIENEESILGIAVLAESHTSLHLNRQTGAVYFDLFSCKDFDGIGLQKLVEKALRMDIARTHTVRRDAKPSFRI